MTFALNVVRMQCISVDFISCGFVRLATYERRVMEAPSGQNHDNKIAPQVNLNATAANIMDMLCIFVITEQYFFSAC